MTGALTRAIGAAAEEVVAGAKPTFGQIFSGQPEPATADTEPPTIVQQLTDRIKHLLSDAGIELAAAVSFAVSAEGALVVAGQHPQRELIETAIAHDTSIEQWVDQWVDQVDQSQGREPRGLTIAASFDRPAGF